MENDHRKRRVDDSAGLGDDPVAGVQSSPRRVPPWVLAVLSIGTSVVLLAALALTVDMSVVVDILVSTRPAAIVGPVLAIAVSFVFATLRFRAILVGLTGGHPGIMPLIRLNFLTSLLVHVLPVSALADAVRTGFIRALVRVPMLRAAETVIVDRALGLLMLVCLALAILPVHYLVYGAGPVFAAQAALLLAMAVAAVGMFWAVRRLAGGALGKVRWFRAVAAVAERFRTLLSGVESWGAQAGFAAAGGIAVALAFWTLGLAMDLEISLWTACLISPILMISQSLPITYAGWGSRDAVVIALSGWALPVSDAEAFALSIAMGVVIFLASLPGFVFFLVDFRAMARPDSNGAGTD